MTDTQTQSDDGEPLNDEVGMNETSPEVAAQEIHEGDGEQQPSVLGQPNDSSPQITGTGDRMSLSSESSSENESLRNKVPRFNCPEHIIMCLDLSSEMNSMSFQCKSGPERTIFQLVQRSVEIFVKTKSRMNPKHQFSIMVLDDKASWFKHFTTDVDAVCDTLGHLSPKDDDTVQGTFQMSDLLEAVKENITLPVVDDVVLPPAYVLRLIIVYGRSYCMPEMSPDAKQLLSSLLGSPYFFLDVLYVHELPSEMNLCKEIYDYFCDMDDEEEGYMLEVSRSTTRLFDHMAALLAHPLQRPKQRNTFYKLIPRHDEESIL